jgi:uncharacterized protein YlxW (UPF0749 family)
MSLERGGKRFGHDSLEDGMYRSSGQDVAVLENEISKLQQANEQLLNKIEELEQKLTRYVDEQTSSIKQEFVAEMFFPPTLSSSVFSLHHFFSS